MNKLKRLVVTGAVAVAGLAGGVGLVAASSAPASAIDYSYRIPTCAYDSSGPGLKNWHGYSKQDGWSKWFYTKGGCNTAAVEHWGDVTKND